MSKPVDVSKIEVGDTVTAKFVVSSLGVDGVFFRYPLIAGYEKFLPHNIIASHTPVPRAFKAGDPVLVDGDIPGKRWLFVHSHRDMSWIERGCGTERYWVEASRLRHADEAS